MTATGNLSMDSPAHNLRSRGLPQTPPLSDIYKYNSEMNNSKPVVAVVTPTPRLPPYNTRKRKSPASSSVSSRESIGSTESLQFGDKSKTTKLMSSQVG